MDVPIVLVGMKTSVEMMNSEFKILVTSQKGRGRTEMGG